MAKNDLVHSNDVSRTIASPSISIQLAALIRSSNYRQVNLRSIIILVASGRASERRDGL